MKPEIFKNKSKVIIPSALVFLFIAFSFIPPVYINYVRNNWEEILLNKLEFIQSDIQESFTSRGYNLIEQTKYNKSVIKSKLNNSTFYYENKRRTDNDLIVHLYNENFELIFWNYEQISANFNRDYFINYLDQTCFSQFKLTTYLTYYDTLLVKDKLYYLSTAKPIEKSFILNTDRFEKISITDSLSQTLQTSVKILFDPVSTINKDGRFFSFPILNNYKNKIGTVILEKPSLDNKVIEVNEIFRLIQSIVLIILFVYSGIVLFPVLQNEKKKLIKFLYILFFLTAFRILLFIFEIPSSLMNNSLTESGNFSSTFAYGIVRSPLELFITSIFTLLIIYTGFNYILEYYDSRKRVNKNKILFFLVLIVCSFIFLLTLRGLGASLRSVVFDSSIRYFKEFNLIPDAATFLMQLNILIIGIGTVLTCLILMIIVFSLNPYKEKKINLMLISFFVLMQLFGWIFDNLQKQPQGTPLIRILFIAIVFALLYQLLVFNYRSILKYLYMAFGASIAAVMLLTYYNSEIERESLKTTAIELTKTDENIYRFMVHQTLLSAKENEEIKFKLIKQEELNSTAFVVWNSSLLHTENVPVYISFYDLNGNILGNFTNSKKQYEIGKSSFENLSDDIQIDMIRSIFGKQKIIKGVTTIQENNITIGFIEIKVILDETSFGFENIPYFLNPVRAGISSAVEIADLNILYIVNGILEKDYGTLRLSDIELERIANIELKDNQEAWLNMKIADEEYLIYVFATENSSNRLALAKAKNNLTWNLSNFFKVFFVHTFMILTITLFTSIWNYKKTLIFIRSYRTKLASVFIIVAVIPLFIVALYFRNITEKKNVELITTRLTETNERLISYLTNYSLQSLAKPDLIFTKAAEDIGLDFTVYNNKEIEFSTVTYLYNSGLLPAYVPFDNYLELIRNGFNSSITVNYINGIRYYSSYKIFHLNNNIYIVEINSLFNKISLPLSVEELDIFMFGLYSAAVVLLIILSTVLANQISFPIRKLTHATRSLGSGDLNVEVHGNFSGEIEELKNGFNMMVKKLKKSQLEMARFERETAWKEMAKQVAHEIKNPLTPMKLSVQQLITSFNDKSPKFDSIFNKVTSTLINQIETLRNIASEFSNFARMPKLNIEKIEVVSSVKDTVNLFIDEKLSIVIINDEENVYIDADQDQFNRTIINLVRNSIQAKANNITIEVKIDSEFCIIRILDDGIGIDEEIMDRVFEENFTTKTQGMGLGLSMAKKFIDHIGGTIKIEKSNQNGTVILMKIPIAK